MSGRRFFSIAAVAMAMVNTGFGLVRHDYLFVALWGMGTLVFFWRMIADWNKPPQQFTKADEAEHVFLVLVALLVLVTVWTISTVALPTIAALQRPH